MERKSNENWKETETQMERERWKNAGTTVRDTNYFYISILFPLFFCVASSIIKSIYQLKIKQQEKNFGINN